jgi:hypothetical protein
LGGLARNITATFEAGWDGGDILIDGFDQFGNPQQEYLVAVPGSTVVGNLVFGWQLNGSYAGTATKDFVGTAKTVSFGIGDKMGLCWWALYPEPVAPGTIAVSIDASNYTNEVAVWNLVGPNQHITPTSLPDGINQYWITYPIG